jgi:hypothetical protein
MITCANKFSESQMWIDAFGGEQIEERGSCGGERLGRRVDQ